ncbi:hypothetical protein PPL_09768 [Heterostelium album PN500]|uniref:Uncharacterized protein n=1 Tax=Heterostelium pallidum (strain ATCC 26659 / Pp 5 / PN500) TaxID=670386 RepID=D3BP06_HETP5|nr:hypothetical protein PPL_09768 [Heterostelium album PN500]EFA77016.1 hypothetical protein PPL_09768 [Heterostelium album PN500]|eukprot:XP_020429146.1 hypothetical protein PPL_09768 [Heterostelium album PN500]
MSEVGCKVLLTSEIDYCYPLPIIDEYDTSVRVTGSLTVQSVQLLPCHSVCKNDLHQSLQKNWGLKILNLELISSTILITN